MGTPLSIREVSEIMHRALVETVKAKIPDEPGQTDLLNDKQRLLGARILNEYSAEMFYDVY